jgi:hypothetical protein
MSLKAKVGDLIQYRFNNGAFTSRNTRRVVLVDADGYRVEGGYRVKRSDVFTVIPMHEEAPLTSDVTLKLSEQLGGREGDPAAKQSAQPSEHRSLTTSDFPMEAGQ